MEEDIAEACGGNIAATTIAHLINAHPSLVTKQKLINDLHRAIKAGEAQRFRERQACQCPVKVADSKANKRR